MRISVARLGQLHSMVSQTLWSWLRALTVKRAMTPHTPDTSIGVVQAIIRVVVSQHCIGGFVPVLAVRSSLPKRLIGGMVIIHTIMPHHIKWYVGKESMMVFGMSSSIFAI